MHPAILLVTGVLSTAIVFLSEPYFSKKLVEGGFVARDMYKPGEVYIPNKGGLLILFGALVSLILMTLGFRTANFFLEEQVFPRSLSTLDEAMLYTVLIFAFFGVLDDYIDVGRRMKMVLPLFFSYPIMMALVMPTHLPVPVLGEIDLTAVIIPLGGGGGITLSQIVRYGITPVYIMVVANLVNMHSGFNGLQSGVSLIVLISLFLKEWLYGDMDDMLTAAAITGGLAGFWWYNRYPARFFEGNIGSMAIGATIGGIIVTKHLYFTGFVMLIPHTINFLMYVYWRFKRWTLVRQGREVGPYHHQIKFGKIRDDGTLDVPNRLTLKWFIPFHRPTTEPQAVRYMYILSAIFCFAGIIMPYY